ncbi:hypothetical protein ACQ4PT_060993 [Festuca glaucescens]
MFQHLASPAFPLLLLSGNDRGTAREKHLHYPEDSGILQVPIPSMLRNMRLCGSYDGGWVSAVATPSKVVIANLFFGVDVVLSTEQQRSIAVTRHGGAQCISKIIFSEVPTSSNCILVALTIHLDHKMALCRVSCPNGGWSTHSFDGELLGDIVFHHGEIYGVTKFSKNLFKFDICVNKDGAPVVVATHPMDVQRPDYPRYLGWFMSNATYIFGLHGKLAI